ncbi:MAG: ribonuclease HII [Candidatus Saccharibacteria bacterium]|jgi:ribonuclease HII
MARTWATHEVEEAARIEGFALVAGVDEVGRGPLAGPVSLGLVILPEDFSEPVVDSKLLSAKQREEKAIVIRASATSWVVVHIAPEYIDQHGLTASLIAAGRQAWSQIELTPDVVYLDGRHNYLRYDVPVRTLVKGDQVCASIAAASILAKVERDSYMREQALIYPEYGFETHVGYGTPRHLAALRKHGLTPLHRRSFMKGVEYGEYNGRRASR